MCHSLGSRCLQAPGPENSPRAREQGAPQEKAGCPAGLDRTSGAGGSAGVRLAVGRPVWGHQQALPFLRRQRDVAPATRSSSLVASQFTADLGGL